MQTAAFARRMCPPGAATPSRTRLNFARFAPSQQLKSVYALFIDTPFARRANRRNRLYRRQ
ncbi:hypothetical protein A3K89_06445 [Rhodococcoides kyotonense]|uniref:Uncharacterized protein n=1 Tax=Rhodococcoides kyotonense TaxID=398843 RepID=A0A177YAB5_9NOCA|nr:hypothetical protein A3K89_06445 [Rhodococcus kyotonensis]